MCMVCPICPEKTTASSKEKEVGCLRGRKIVLDRDASICLLRIFLLLALTVGILLTTFGAGAISGYAFNAALLWSGILVTAVVAIPVFYMIAKASLVCAGAKV